MERSRSLPVGGTNAVAVNPFWTDKVKEQCWLEAARPVSLPMRHDGAADPEISFALQRGESGPTGKGRGGVASAGMLQALEPPVDVTSGPRRTEGRMPPREDGLESMGAVGASEMRHEEPPEVSSLQRALEGELVDFLRNQNAQLMTELASLKEQIEKEKNKKKGQY